MCSVCDCICCLPMNGAEHLCQLPPLETLGLPPLLPSFPPSAYSFSITPSDLHLINCSLSFFSLPSPYPSISSPLLSFDSLSLSPLSPPPPDLPRAQERHAKALLHPQGYNVPELSEEKVRVVVYRDERGVKTSVFDSQIHCISLEDGDKVGLGICCGMLAR